MSTDSKGHVPSSLDKWLLVKYGKYAKKEEIPSSVSSVMMRRVHDRARVHVSMGIMFFAAISMFANALIGKRQQKQGVSLEKIAQQYQEDYNRRKEEELSKTKAI